MAVIHTDFPAPGWYRTRDEVPYGRLTLVTDQLAPSGRRRVVVFQVAPTAGRLVCTRTVLLPGEAMRDCAEMVIPPDMWRGLPTASVVTTAEERATQL